MKLIENSIIWTKCQNGLGRTKLRIRKFSNSDEDLNFFLLHFFYGRIRAGTGSKFSGCELFRVSIVEPELRAGIWGYWLEFSEPLKFSRAWYILLSHEPWWACIKAHGLGQYLSPGSIGHLAYLLRAFLQARAFEPGRVLVPALDRMSLTRGETSPLF